MVGELLNNAIKYAPSATITTSVTSSQDTAVVVISDDGPGLSDAELDLAATRFWRSPGHSSVSGTGLGMTIVSELAAANGGSLVLATAVPQGLSARLVFPLVQAPDHRGESHRG